MKQRKIVKEKKKRKKTNANKKWFNILTTLNEGLFY